jgi:stringent starvation protein B
VNPSPTLTSRRPYLVRAMHEWMTDNGQTPHLVVDATLAGVEVPQAYVKDGRIILNVGWQATQALRLGNDFIEFSARFGGTPHLVRVPLAAVTGIYARETGQGMLFQGDDSPPPPEPPTATTNGGSTSDTGRRAKLRVVK